MINQSFHSVILFFSNNIIIKEKSLKKYNAPNNVTFKNIFSNFCASVYTSYAA